MKNHRNTVDLFLLIKFVVTNAMCTDNAGSYLALLESLTSGMQVEQ